MRFLLLWGCVALCVLVVASHSDRAESKDVESQGRDPDERRKRTRVNVSTKTKPRVSPRSGAFSALSRKGEVKTARNKRTTAKGSTRTRVPKLPGVFSAVARPPRNRRALQNIKPTRKPRPGVYGPLRELSRRDTEDVEKQNKRQKHFKKRGRGDKRRGRKNDDKGFRPQVEVPETMRDNRGHHREDKPHKKHRPGVFTSLIKDGKQPDDLKE
ncbi:uncharacterized protein LOC142159421 [Mixophyes fleayi]|uniref:uncharacterized protein LOC142159421 n=1 Tax=Mixophyes fleayi TaxID=3061075 RepID=UPI003F4E1B8E